MLCRSTTLTPPQNPNCITSSWPLPSAAIRVLGRDQRGPSEKHEVFPRADPELWYRDYSCHFLHQDSLLADPGEEHQVDEGHAEVPAVDQQAQREVQGRSAAAERGDDEAL